MNQLPDPDQQNPQNPQPTVNTPNSVPPTMPASQQLPHGDDTSYSQPGATPTSPAYNQLGNYPPPVYNQPGNYPPPAYPPQLGIPKRRKIGWIIGGISLVVVIIIAVTLISTHGFRQEPPSGWLYQSSTSSSTVIYFIQWTNQDGQLNGSWNITNGSSSLAYQMDGTYNYQNHSVVLNIHYSFLSIGVTKSFRGNIQGNVMTLHTTSDFLTGTINGDMVFHSASQQDYDNAKQNLSATPG